MRGTRATKFSFGEYIALVGVLQQKCGQTQCFACCYIYVISFSGIVSNRLKALAEVAVAEGGVRVSVTPGDKAGSVPSAAW